MRHAPLPAGAYLLLRYTLEVSPIDIRRSSTLPLMFDEDFIALLIIPIFKQIIGINHHNDVWCASMGY